MKLPIIKRLNKGEIPGIPSWYDPILNTLNTFMERVVQTLSNHITFEDNFQCIVKSLTFTHGVEQIISIFGISSYSGCFPVGYTEDTSTDNILTGFKARLVAPGQIGITVLFNGGAGKLGTIKFVVLG